MLEQARGALLGRVAGLPTPALLALLEASFPFVGIPELRGVPLAVSRACLWLMRRQSQYGAASRQGWRSLHGRVLAAQRATFAVSRGGGPVPSRS